jgi:hypothetical protein
MRSGPVGRRRQTVSGTVVRASPSVGDGDHRQGRSERIVVTLIHGTFATEAEWVRNESKLCKAVNDAFPGGVEFRRLPWSGGNTIGARQDAAGKLREQILADPVSAADTRHFLVAHSHGGNIALYALRDPKVRERITGVATLATPFLIARKRDLGTQGLSLFCVGFLGWLRYSGASSSRSASVR